MTYILRILPGGRLEEPRAEPGNGAAVGGGVEGNLAVAPCLASSLGHPVGRTQPPQHLCVSGAERKARRLREWSVGGVGTPRYYSRLGLRVFARTAYVAVLVPYVLVAFAAVVNNLLFTVI